MIRRSAALALLLAGALAGSAAADARSDGDLRALRGDDALLVLPIDSSDELAQLEFYDLARKRAFTIDDVPDRRSLVLAKLPAGDYYLRKIVLPKDRWVEYEANAKWIPRFTLKAGAINYAGDARVAYASGRVTISFGGDSLDALPTLLRRETDLAPDLFERFPFALAAPLDGKALLGKEPPADLRLAGWLDAVPGLAPAAQDALAAAVFARLGGALPVPGTGFAAARESLGALSKRRAHSDGIASDQELLVHLDGLWGERGEVLGMRLLFVDDRLAQTLVHALDDTALWRVPAPDAREDLAAFAAGR